VDKRRHIVIAVNKLGANQKRKTGKIHGVLTNNCILCSPITASASESLLRGTGFSEGSGAGAGVAWASRLSVFSCPSEPRANNLSRLFHSRNKDKDHGAYSSLRCLSAIHKSDSQNQSLPHTL
jgi:hypothetical protein